MTNGLERYEFNEDLLERSPPSRGVYPGDIQSAITGLTSGTRYFATRVREIYLNIKGTLESISDDVRSRLSPL